MNLPNTYPLCIFCVEKDIDITNLFELDGSSIRELMSQCGETNEIYKVIK